MSVQRTAAANVAPALASATNELIRALSEEGGEYPVVAVLHLQSSLDAARRAVMLLEKAIVCAEHEQEKQREGTCTSTKAK